MSDTPDDLELIHADTPEETIAYLEEEIAAIRAKLRRLNRSASAGSSREASEAARTMASLQKQLAEARAALPPPEDQDPETLRAAVAAYVRTLPADDPMRVVGLPDGARIRLPKPPPATTP